MRYKRVIRRTACAALIVNPVDLPVTVAFMCAHELVVLELYVVLGAGPRFFVPPISREQKRSALIDNLAADFVTLEISMVGNKNRRSRRRPKSSETRFLL